MSDPRRDPLAVRMSIALFRAIKVLVPSSIRQDWLLEWEAEIRHRWSTVNRGPQTRWQDQADVVRRSTGAISDAAWLRQQFTADHDVMRDVQYALRMLGRRPVISTLAVAIGYPDLVQVFAGTVLNQTGAAIQVMAITLSVYLAISLLTSIAMNLFNQRFAIVER